LNGGDEFAPASGSAIIAPLGSPFGVLIYQSKRPLYTEVLHESHPTKSRRVWNAVLVKTRLTVGLFD
jgi:hypothetical protein